MAHNMADTEDETSPLIKPEREDSDSDEHTQPETRKINRAITVEPLLVLYFMAFAPSVPLYEQYVYQQISESITLRSRRMARLYVTLTPTVRSIRENRSYSHSLHIGLHISLWPV